MAINLEVTVELYHVISKEGVCSDNDFVNFIPNFTLSELNIHGLFNHGNVYVSVTSRIPISSGLKRNSAIATGIVDAVVKYAGLSYMSKLDIAKIAAKATKAHGSSITGAFDDALASILRGIVFTDNRNMRLIKHISPLRDDLSVVITNFKKTKRLDRIDRLRSLAPIYEELFHRALHGDLWEAATINGILVALSLGYHDELRTINEAIRLGVLSEDFW
ncbi:shikimate kinase [Vulcanisaeta thermophila]|uniref:shikimate kinase n=1 Tax=Vulcanisaeta thermophila TaxID=867917 RepID=UPI000A97FECC|nr:shikimate kinase [Vulcanisaeta thermophila]